MSLLHHSWLQVEVWDREEVRRQKETEYTSTGAARADPLLLVARGRQPKVRRALCGSFGGGK